MAHHPRRRPQRKIIQDSPFLNLPGEIRTHIYRLALTRPTPIDLWPQTYIENPEEDPSLAQRIAKARRKLGDDAHIPKFRRQDDLRYVRKEMATGLFATCMRIFIEAADLFWGENTFRFSGDVEWFGVRRFLTEIGPRALSKIRSLELFAPLSDS